MYSYLDIRPITIVTDAYQHQKELWVIKYFEQKQVVAVKNMKLG